MSNSAQAELLPTVTTQDGFLAVIAKAASDPNVDTDKMKALLDMQERIIDKNAAAEFDKSLVACQAEMPSIARDAENRQTSSMYARLESVIKKIKPIYQRHGFAPVFSEGDSPRDGYIRILCELSHKAGHKRTYHHDLPLDDVGLKGTANKTKVHATGSTISYGRRYLLGMIFNLAFGDDNDAQGGYERISESQVADLEALIEDVGADKAQFLKFCKLDKLEDMNVNAYSGAVNALEQKRKQK